jgi:hypothetical protein
MAGVDVLLVARMAGTSVAMIERVYGHFRNQSYQEAQARLDLEKATRGLWPRLLRANEQSPAIGLTLFVRSPCLPFQFITLPRNRRLVADGRLALYREAGQVR